jgi:hypothetical protein
MSLDFTGQAIPLDPIEEARIEGVQDRLEIV